MRELAGVRVFSLLVRPGLSHRRTSASAGVEEFRAVTVKLWVKSHCATPHCGLACGTGWLTGLELSTNSPMLKVYALISLYSETHGTLDCSSAVRVLS